jgi:LEA14-like dessication related protein
MPGFLRFPVLLPAVWVLALAGCASLTQSWQTPEVAVTSIKPQQLTLQQQTMQVGLKIRNPNDRMLPIKAMTYRLYLEGDQIASGGGALDRQIPAFGEEDVEVSLIGDGAALIGMLPALALQSRPWRYKIAGTATVAGVLPLPYSYSGEIDPQTLLRQRPLSVKPSP